MNVTISFDDAGGVELVLRCKGREIGGVMDPATAREVAAALVRKAVCAEMVLAGATVEQANALLTMPEGGGA